MILSTAFVILAAASAAAGESLSCHLDEPGRFVEVRVGAAPALRYHYGVTPVPEGIDPAFERGGYVSALYGMDGELLTEDFPLDHVHHRAVNWTWATTSWNGEIRDMYAVRNPHEGGPIIGGLWHRPVGVPTCQLEDGVAVIEARGRWMWDDETAIVDEWVRIEVNPLSADHRSVSFTIRLIPLVDGLEFAGRLGQGYSGFNIRMAAGADQRIRLHNDPPEAMPRRSYADYSAQIEGAPGRSGLAILQHPANPDYPGQWLEYPSLNFFQPAYPGGELVPMPKAVPITLRYRLIVHRDALEDDTLAGMWDAYQDEPLAASVPMNDAQGGEAP